MLPLYEDNHIIIVSKAAGEIVQGDKTGDAPLTDAVKAYLKARHGKPGNVFLGVVHRLDRPTTGIVVFAKTSKALSRLNEMFRLGQVHKTYHALVPRLATFAPDASAVRLTHYLTRNEKQNKSYAREAATAGAKLAVLDYRPLASSDRYTLLEVRLHTGRHHQIRCQLSHIGMPIKGDLKYGAPRSNPDASICLHARHISFIHPVSKAPVTATAPYPSLGVWRAFEGDGVKEV